MEMATSKTEAIDKGLKRYFTGVPCRNGHISERSIAGKCYSCAKDKRSRHASKIKAYQAEYRSDHKDEHKDKKAAYAKKYYEDNKESLNANYKGWSKIYRGQNKELLAEKQRRYYQKNKERLLAKAKKNNDESKRVLMAYENGDLMDISIINKIKGKLKDFLGLANKG